MLCLFLAVLWVIVAVPGCTHLLFKLTFSIQFLKVVRKNNRTFSDDVHCHLHEF